MPKLLLACPIITLSILSLSAQTAKRVTPVATDQPATFAAANGESGKSGGKSG